MLRTRSKSGGTLLNSAGKRKLAGQTRVARLQSTTPPLAMSTSLRTPLLLLSLSAAALFAAAPALAQTAGMAEPGTPSQTADLSAEAFARAATENGLAELMLSYVALQKAREGAVEDFSWTMIEHHGSAIGGLAEALSGQPSVLPAGLPMGPSAEQVQEIERLRGLAGDAFDQAYFEHQVEAHREVIALYEAGSRVADEGVARYAATTLPLLRAHLEIAQMKRAQVQESAGR